MIVSRLAPAALLAATLLPGVALAQQISVDKVGCKKGVHLTASHAPLSSVLAELSKQLQFELRFEGDIDRTIDIDTTRRGPDLVAKLMSDDSVIYDDAPDPKCPGLPKLTRVWVLPKGQDGPPPPRELTPMELYRKAHGLPPEEPDQGKKE